MRFARPALPALAIILTLIAAAPGLAAVPLTRVSTDPYTNTTSQHRTEVEPDTFVAGNTIVSAFQVGRISGRLGQHRLCSLGRPRRHLDQRFPPRHHRSGHPTRHLQRDQRPGRGL
jgi:hypothetical protein